MEGFYRSPESKLLEAKEKRMQVGRARSLHDLYSIERDRNYKPGWAENVFKSRQNRGN